MAQNPAGMTLEQIGATMNITRERVRQIESTALRKISQNSGSDITVFGGFTIAIPSCRKCGEPFIRAAGRQEMCAPCDAARKRKRRLPPSILTSPYAMSQLAH